MSLMTLAVAVAQTAPGAAQEPPPLWLQFLPLVVLVAIFYFLLIRPQKRRQQEHQKMVQDLHKGDSVVTVGGLMGEIADVRDQFFVVKLADNVRVRITRNAVAAKMSPGDADKKEHEDK